MAVRPLRSAAVGGVVDVEHRLVVDEDVAVERVVVGAGSRGDLIDVRSLPVAAVGGTVGEEVVHHRRP